MHTAVFLQIKSFVALMRVYRVNIGNSEQHFLYIDVDIQVYTSA